MDWRLGPHKPGVGSKLGRAHGEGGHVMLVGERWPCAALVDHAQERAGRGPFEGNKLTEWPHADWIWTGAACCWALVVLGLLWRATSGLRKWAKIGPKENKPHGP